MAAARKTSHSVTCQALRMTRWSSCGMSPLWIALVRNPCCRFLPSPSPDPQLQHGTCPCSGKMNFLLGAMSPSQIAALCGTVALQHDVLVHDFTRASHMHSCFEDCKSELRSISAMEIALVCGSVPHTCTCVWLLSAWVLLLVYHIGNASAVGLLSSHAYCKQHCALWCGLFLRYTQ